MDFFEIVKNDNPTNLNLNINSSSKIIWHKTDDNKIINEKYIRWIKKLDDCLEVCTKSTGCGGGFGGDTHKICYINNSESYNNLNRLFGNKSKENEISKNKEN
jgi:hypothetical protein